MSNAGKARKVWKSGAFASPRCQKVPRRAAIARIKKKPAAGGGDSGLDLKCSAGGGPLHSAPASHLGGGDARQQNHTDNRQSWNAQIVYRRCEIVIRAVRWWLAPSTNPARRPHRGPLSRFPLGDDKTGVHDERESAGQIDKVGFQTNCRVGICACRFVVCSNACAVTRV